MYKWQRLDKAQTDFVLSKIDGPNFDELFKRNRAEVMISPLSFYNDFLLYRMTSYAVSPALTLEFLGDGQNFYFLDGNPDAIYHVNKLDPINLSKRTIVDYLEFFFEKVEKDDVEDIKMIRNVETSPFLTTANMTFRKEVANAAHGIKLKYEPESNRFLVKSPMYYSGALISALVAVQANGEMELLEHNLLFASFSTPIDSHISGHFGDSGNFS